MAKKPPLGSGKRFTNLEHKLSAGHEHIKNPAALAAYIGRKSLGAKKFNALATKGRARAAK
jgi:hypothetical protein